MNQAVTERHASGYDWRSRFPEAALVVAMEGGAVYAAEDRANSAYWLISDESSMADFLMPDDANELVTLTRYGARSRREWVQDAVAIRRLRHLSPADVTGKSWPGPNDADLIRLIDDIADRIERQAEAEELLSVNEQRHLQPRTVDAARALGTSDGPSLRTQAPVDFDVWPRLGNIDVVLAWRDNAPVLMELKCGSGIDAIGECAWDAAKLALCLQREAGGAAFLLAGAPVADWQKPIRGTEFFSHGPHEAALVRVLYADWFRQFEGRDDPQPSALPRSWWTEHVHSAGFQVGGINWELRLAQVFVSGKELTPWPRLAATRER